MKHLLLALGLFTFSMEAFCEETYEYYGGGYKMSCSRARNNDNHLIRAGQWENITDAAQQAKLKCELATGKICGVIFIGDRMREEDLGYSVCRSYGVAKPF